MQAYKPTTSIESILGPTAAPAPVPEEPKPVAPPIELETTIPDVQRFQPQSAGDGIAPPLAAIIAVDPVEYELHPHALKPSRDYENPALRSLDRLAGLLALHNARSGEPDVLSVPASLQVLDAVSSETPLTVSGPEWSPNTFPDLPLRGLVALPEIQGRELRIAPQEPEAFEIQPVRALSHTLAPQGGDVLTGAHPEQSTEQETFPLHQTLLPLAGPMMAKMASATAPVVDRCESMTFRHIEIARPQAQDAVAQSLGLVGQSKLAKLSDAIAPRDWHGRFAGTVSAIDPRTPDVAMAQVRVHLSAVDTTAELLENSSCAPFASFPMFEPSNVDAAMHPVLFQAFDAETGMLLPDAGRLNAASLGIRFHAQRVLPLDFVDKIVPRGDVRLRGVFPAFPLQNEALIPASRLEPKKAKPVPASVADAFVASTAGKEQSVRGMAANVAGLWKQAPRDLKILLFAVPVALGLAFHPSLPKVSVQAPQTDGKEVTGKFQQVLDTQMASLRKTIADRAAVGLDENFRQGLDNWMSHSGSTAEWSFDQAGFVQPGRVALYQPSLGLTDYEFQFLGAIDKGALSWVTRAVDFQNYYVVKLVVVKPGPVPEMGITRYAVVDGKPMDRIDTAVTFSARTDSLYRVSHVMDGDHHSLVIQGQMIDSWNEPRLKRGGVGFFTNQGEKSRIGWVQITHQYDMLGRLFAYLAP